MIAALTNPIRHALPRLISEVAVSVRTTLSSSRADARGKDLVLAVFRVVALHHAHSHKRFRQPSGDFLVDLGPRSKNGADSLERTVQSQAKQDENEESGGSHRGADSQQNNGGEDCRHNTARKFHQARADQVPHTLDVAHDAGDESARLVRVIERHGKAADVALHLHAKLRDHPLRRFREKLREGKRCEPLHNRCRNHQENYGPKELYLALGDYIVDQIFRRVGRNQSGDPIDGHQDQAASQQAAPRLE